MLNNVASNDARSRFAERGTLMPAWTMKKVEAIIRPSRLSAVQEALERRGIGGFTFSDVKGAGHENGRTQLYRGTAYAVDFIARVKVEVLVRDADAVPLAHAIVDAARTGRVGDGLVLILPVAEAVRIRTGERAPEAVEHGPRASEHDPMPLAM